MIWKGGVTLVQRKSSLPVHRSFVHFVFRLRTTTSCSHSTRTPLIQHITPLRGRTEYPCEGICFESGAALKKPQSVLFSWSFVSRWITELQQSSVHTVHMYSSKHSAKSR